MTDALELIGHIYDAAFDAALWPDVLTRLSDAVGGAEVCMFVCDPSTSWAAVIAPRHDPDYVRSIGDTWLPGELQRKGKTFGQRLLGAPIGQLLDAHQLVPNGFFRTDFYNAWWRPQGLSLFGVGTKWRVGRHAWGFCFVHGSSRSSGLEVENTKLFGFIVPHLVRAAELHLRLSRLDLEQESILVGLTRPDQGVIFVDAAARVVYASDPAGDLIRARDGLLVDRSELTTRDADAAVTLGRLIAGCAERRLTDGGAGGAISVRRGERLPLRVLVAPVHAARLQDREWWSGFRRPVAILIVDDPELQRRTDKARLQEEFGLTPTEAEVALEIGKGDGRDAAAARLAMTPGTLRIHLQRVFEKAGVHRQAALVRLLAHGAVSRRR